MTGSPKRWLPAAVVILGTAAMAVAARRAGGLDAGLADGVWKNARPLGALIAVVALVVIATRFARHRDDGYGVLHRAGTATGLLLYVAVVLTPIGLLFFGRKPETQPLPPVDNRTGGTLRPPPGYPINGGKQGQSHGLTLADIIILVVLSLIVLALLTFIVYTLIRMLARLRLNRQPVPRIDFEPLGPEVEQLAEAVRAGAEALEYEGDAREAVIACYSAMELAVSAGGSVGRRATDTPDEFLRRVTAARLIPEEPASRLTELFHEARFSRHPIAEGQRDEAREALRTISEHLRGRMAARAASQAAARAAATADQSPAHAGVAPSSGGRAG